MTLLHVVCKHIQLNTLFREMLQRLDTTFINSEHSTIDTKLVGRISTTINVERFIN